MPDLPLLIITTKEKRVTLKISYKTFIHIIYIDIYIQSDDATVIDLPSLDDIIYII